MSHMYNISRRSLSVYRDSIER